MVVNSLSKPDFLLRERNGNIVQAKQIIDPKAQITLYDLNPQKLHAVKKQLEIQRGGPKFTKLHRWFRAFQNFAMFFGRFDKQLFHQGQIAAIGYAHIHMETGRSVVMRPVDDRILD